MIHLLVPNLCRHSIPNGHGIQFCPLYVASHAAGLPTCMTGDWQLGCAVSRGRVDYDALIERLRGNADGEAIIEKCELEMDWAERMERVAQRKRNCRTNGIAE